MFIPKDAIEELNEGKDLMCKHNKSLWPVSSD